VAIQKSRLLKILVKNGSIASTACGSRGVAA
jgi:hypothetical protein